MCGGTEKYKRTLLTGKRSGQDKRHWIERHVRPDMTVPFELEVTGKSLADNKLCATLEADIAAREAMMVGDRWSNAIIWFAIAIAKPCLCPLMSASWSAGVMRHV
ncbi:hypothetical protein DFH28DRAFT_925539 [Melampsora americana]|nr:hypothetical protein DFH28DRAFT_925539 [Melampsora americana]